MHLGILRSASHLCDLPFLFPFKGLACTYLKQNNNSLRLSLALPQSISQFRPEMQYTCTL